MPMIPTPTRSLRMAFASGKLVEEIAAGQHVETRRRHRHDDPLDLAQQLLEALAMESGGVS